ncbi:MAG: TonB-dependent receptor [Brumimicrobium sp.]|nr:TonB-dependent receptor [Brumimicrobium sp.]MCO5267714.1 TonB-dependent receptor [Brumimicrobium sp.]
MKLFLIIFTILSLNAYSQEIKGSVTDTGGEPLIGVLINTDQGVKSRTDVEGNFTITINQFPVSLTLSMYDFKDKVVKLDTYPQESIKIKMEPTTQELEGVVVSASRRKQNIEDVTVSIEIIKSDYITNKGITNIEKAIDLAPGAYTMDGQVSIRGGSGFAYGAGSRVMVVWNDLPMLSADAGDAKFESIPMENLDQIEILKGASSVLYGSGALNGIVSLRSKEPTKEGETKINYQIGVFDKAPREGLRWTKKSLFDNQLSIYNGQMFKKFGYTVSAYAFRSDGYRKGTERDRLRFSGSFLYKPERTKRLKLGLDYSFSMERKGEFLIWESAEYGYTPSGGMGDPYAPGSTLSYIEALRIRIDPYAVFYDKQNNKHSLMTRYYNTTNKSLGGYDATANTIYADYKFERRMRGEWVLTVGATGKWDQIVSQLYGNHTSQNYAMYGQIEKTFWEKLSLIAGFRGEFYQVNNNIPDSRIYLSKTDSTKTFPIRPIFRVGANYKVLPFTNIRASFGQAYRFPSIAERYASTSVGMLNIFPNENLQSESGWSAELGVKQGFRIKDFKGFIDVSGFINEYKNMMEFTFGFYIPDSIPPSFNPNLPGYVGNWYGFRAENAEHARIVGAELSVSGTGSIGPLEITTLLGYTYMHPIVLNPDSSYIYGTENLGAVNGGLSNPESNMLKYRFSHMAKADIQFKLYNVFVGFSGRYNSFMVNIDKSFESGVEVVLIGNQQVLPGLKEYREKHNKGDFVLDLRLGYDFGKKYQLSFLINNVLNNEYTTRPGDIQPPRQFMLRFQANI